MARPLRIEFPGAIYHVATRGNARRAVFRDDADRNLFLDALSEVVARFGWICHAYCLMDRHYRLLIETPRGNLSPGMRQLNGIYTQRFNRRHARAGHVFQGRFKAILIERERYLLELARYIVIDPVRAKLVKKPGRYRWSSYLATVGAVASPAWLNTDWILGQLAKTRPVAQRRYAEFVEQDGNLPSPWSGLKRQVLLGSDAFVAKMRPLLEDKGALKRIPLARRQARPPGLKSLFSARVRQDKPQRDAAIHRACLEYGYTMAAVARAAGIHYSTVSKIIKGER
jgi:REP-associated tyrosine transposase